METFLFPQWGSQQAGHRQLIRQHMHEHFADQASSEILNLDALPTFHQGYASVSHTKGLGGYAWSHQPVGLDLEENHRVTIAAVLRVSSQQELDQAPSPTALWCAKESVFKALSQKNLREHSQDPPPKLVSGIEISQWKGSQFFLRGMDNGIGRIEALPKHLVALFYFT